MSEQQHDRLRLCLTGVVALAELAHLTWQHLNGGVVSHHLLRRSDLPAISNWWSLPLLPALTWFLGGRIQRHLALRSAETTAGSALPVRIGGGFGGSLLFGILLSVCFTNQLESTTAYLFQAMLVLAVLLPVYRAESVLGFVLGMSFTFGAVLPAFVSGIISAASALIHLAIRPGLVRAWNALKRRRMGG